MDKKLPQRKPNRLKEYASQTHISTELATFIDGQPDFTKCAQIDLEKLKKICVCRK